MSSLLDILQKKSAQPVTDDTALAPASPGNHMQTVELHLAVDNHSAGEMPATDQTQPAAPKLTVDLQDEPPATGQQTAGTTAENLTDAVADPDGTPADTPHAILVSQRKQRIRRNTSILIGSLVLILLAVTTAISILLQYTADRGGDPSVNIPVELPQAVAPQPAISAPQQAAVRPLRKEVTSTRTVSRPAATPPRDADWYDTPAIETPDATTQIRISRGTTENPLFPKLSDAWNAFQLADYARAETLYREVQAADNSNIDAMLGLAAIALRSGRDQEAQSLYRAVLESDPKNPAAIAALSTLPAGASADGDTGNETQLKNLLREQPGSAPLHFALGVQYVSAGRWPEAQQAFFEAVRNEPTNADYAYNLAVSLDQLGQGSAAAAYYDRALGLANGSVLFDTAAARQRLDSLRAATR